MTRNPSKLHILMAATQLLSFAMLALSVCWTVHCSCICLLHFFHNDLDVFRRQLHHKEREIPSGHGISFCTGWYTPFKKNDENLSMVQWCSV